MKRNTLRVLISELTKYGTLKFGDFISEATGDKLNCNYLIHPEHEDKADFTSLSQNNKDIHGFCVIAALCFEQGVSDVFDFYLNKL